MKEIIKITKDDLSAIINEVLLEVLKKYEILSESDENNTDKGDDFESRAMEVMDASLSEQDKPKVGIFWYSPELKDVFGVVSVNAETMAKAEHRDLVTCKELHKNVWKKNYNYYKHHNEKSPFEGDYKFTPRGRIFYEPDEEKFIIAIGSWIDTCPEALNKIKEAFNLDKPGLFVQVKKGSHWEIGMGYGD